MELVRYIQYNNFTVEESKGNFIFASRSWAHCDFVLYNKVTKRIVCGVEVDGYRYHKSGTDQSVRDRKKDEIFRLIGIPLLRCSTKESGEGEKIRGVLRGESVSF